ncbi:hypothetical protein V2S66_25230 [Streptomyces sp. V4-01]|uniref:Uncharacterized protein n=1 Tax=Actinacidiphila polyblastidii TaxID=3110430 RepID=A0ABU7PHL5_9ACTN|nr:hypothetical protein [Streptomyces sp. V4-01]
MSTIGELSWHGAEASVALSVLNMLFKLLLLEWFSRKEPKTRADVEKFAALLYPKSAARRSKSIEGTPPDSDEDLSGSG